MAVQLSHSMITLKHSLVLVLAVMLICFVSSDVEDDRKECTSQLIGLSTCLPYVGGTAKTPTPECCKGLGQVLTTSKRCLCILIKDRNDPSLGLKLNASLALNLPSICKSSVTLSDCPALLHLAPNSSDAQIFYQFDKSLHSNSAPPSGNPANSNGKEPGADVKNDGELKASISVSESVLLCLVSLLILCI